MTKTKDFLLRDIPPDLHRQIKVRAAEEGKSVAVIVEKLVREYLRKGAAHA